MRFIPYHSSSSGNLYRVESDCGSILLEAGLPIKKIKAALNYRLHTVSAALISHSHGDHSKGVPGLIKAGIDCYMTAETACAISVDGHRVKIIEPMKAFSVGGFTALPFRTEHDCDGSVGFLITDGIDKLVFATDTFYLRHRFRGVTIWAVECNYSVETISPDLDPVRKQRLYSSHFSLENLLECFAANDLPQTKEVHLLHLSEDNSDEEMFEKAVEAATGVPVYVASK